MIFSSGLMQSLTTLALVLLALSAPGCSDDGASDTQTQGEDAAGDLSDATDTWADVGADVSDVDMSDGDRHGDAGEAPTWSGEVWPILQTYACSSGYCHGGGSGGLEWGTAETTYDELVGVVSDSDGGCSDLERVAPSDSANSFLYHKLAGTQSCGEPMPQGGEIASADLAVVRAWIDAGAQR